MKKGFASETNRSLTKLPAELYNDAIMHRYKVNQFPLYDLFDLTVALCHIFAFLS